MWILYTFIASFLMALVNYFDEYLTSRSNVGESKNIHIQIGGLLLISCLFAVFSVMVFSFIIDDFTMTKKGLFLSLFSAIPSVCMYAGYFYLFQKFPANQVVPLFGLSSLWLLFLELISGASIPILGMIGIFTIIYGAYVLDTSSFKWKIPSRLLLYMTGVTFLWALVLFIVKSVSAYENIFNIFFYQYVGIVIIGVILLLTVKNYRIGFIDRVKGQGKLFLGLSVLSEGIAQMSFFLYMLATSLAPLATYVQAIGSVQYIFLFFIFLLFPIAHRNIPNYHQYIAIIMICLGVFLVEFYK